MTLQEVVDNRKFIRAMLKNLTETGFRITGYSPPTTAGAVGIYAELPNTDFTIEFFTLTSMNLIKGGDKWVVFSDYDDDNIVVMTAGLGDFDVFLDITEDELDDVNLVWLSENVIDDDVSVHEYVSYGDIEPKIRYFLER